MIRSEIPSLELCKLLKAYGYPQSAGWFYEVRKEKTEIVLIISSVKEIEKHYYHPPEFIKAPTIGEMRRFLPSKIQINSEEYCLAYFLTNKVKIMYLNERNEQLFSVEELSEANARAMMLILLAKEKIITFNEGGKLC